MSGPARSGSTLAGFGVCLRVLWRRNRVFWILWAVGLAVLMPLTASQYDTIIPPGTDPAATIEPLRHNPSMLALLGPAYDLSTKAGFVFWRVGGFASAFAGMMAAFGIIRATRGEEEDGHLELLRAGPVGRHAPLAAAVALAVAGSLGTGVLGTVLTLASGLPAAGAVAAGLALATPALAFTGIGVVLAQVFESGRTTRYWTVGALWGGMFLLRMMVDGAGLESSWAWARWALPVEWGMLLRPWADERWWVFALPVLLLVVCTGVAFRLSSARDHGAGMLASRTGRATAKPSLSGAWGLAWRLQRLPLTAWSVGLLVSAYGVGSIITQLDDTLTSNPQMAALLQRMGGTDIIQEAFYAAMLGILATLTAIMAAVILSRLRAEETSGHAEPMLATATSRWSFTGSHLAWATLVPALVLAGVGAVVPLAQAQQGGGYATVRDHLAGAAALSPGVLLVVAVAMLLLGWLPNRFALIWAVLAWTLFATWFGALLNLPTWLIELTPFGHLSQPPRDAMDWTPFAVELTLALALLLLGLIGYRRRNIPQ